MSDASFAGKVVIVVGAGRGIGRAVAEGLAARGARLVLDDPGVGPEGGDPDPSVVDTLARGIRDRGGEAVALDLDAAAPGAAETIVDAARERFGRLDGLFVTAGVHRERSLLKTLDADLEALWHAPVLASFRCARAVARALVEQGSPGAILLTAGPQAFFGAARHAANGAGAAAVVAFVRSAALELRRHGVRINALVPTARTRLTEHLPTFQAVRADSLAPDHVEPVAAHLLGDAGLDVTGEAVGVAGTRVYAIRPRETPGAFAGGAAFTAEEIAEVWGEVLRG